MKVLPSMCRIVTRFLVHRRDKLSNQAEECQTLHPLLSAWVDEELAPAEARQLEAHLGHCLACQQELESLQQFCQSLSVVGEIEIPTGVQAAIREALRTEAAYADCERIRLLLSSFLDAELEPLELKAVSSHLDGCRDCSAQLRSLRRTAHLISLLPSVEPPLGLRSRVFARTSRRTAPLKLLPFGAAGLAAAGLLLFSSISNRPVVEHPVILAASPAAITSGSGGVENKAVPQPGSDQPASTTVARALSSPTDESGSKPAFTSPLAPGQEIGKKAPGAATPPQSTPQPDPGAASPSLQAVPGHSTSTAPPVEQSIPPVVFMPRPQAIPVPSLQLAPGRSQGGFRARSRELPYENRQSLPLQPQPITLAARVIHRAKVGAALRARPQISAPQVQPLEESHTRIASIVRSGTHSELPPGAFAHEETPSPMAPVEPLEPHVITLRQVGASDPAQDLSRKLQDDRNARMVAQANQAVGSYLKEARVLGPRPGSNARRSVNDYTVFAVVGHGKVTF